MGSIPLLPGAREALGAVRRQRGRTLVVTGKFPANAQRHLDHLELNDDVDLLEGWVWGVGKAEPLRREGAQIYVGDHVHDVEGARAAGVVSVSVLTGGSTRAELQAAGTDVVLESLEEQVVLLKLMGEANDPTTVHVKIGEENSVEGLRSTSVVTVGYGPDEAPYAGLGILGPTRMDYAGNISSVRAVARYVGDLLAGS